MQQLQRIWKGNVYGKGSTRKGSSCTYMYIDMQVVSLLATSKLYVTCYSVSQCSAGLCGGWQCSDEYRTPHMNALALQKVQPEVVRRSCGSGG